MTIADFIGQLFLARDITHTAHLSTRSFAKHSALGAFYEAVIPLADALAEAYQGRMALIGKIPLQSVKESKDIVKFLQGQLGELEAGRKDILPDDSAIQNIIDEIVALYLSTLYKLRFLA